MIGLVIEIIVLVGAAWREGLVRHPDTGRAEISGILKFPGVRALVIHMDKIVVCDTKPLIMVCGIDPNSVIIFDDMRAARVLCLQISGHEKEQKAADGHASRHLHSIVGNNSVSFHHYYKFLFIITIDNYYCVAGDFSHVAAAIYVAKHFGIAVNV